jgi:hypothetical protein
LRSRSLETTTATSCTCLNATAPCSGATRKVGNQPWRGLFSRVSRMMLGGC